VLDTQASHIKGDDADAPVMLDHLSDVAKQHFARLAHWTPRGAVVINPRMVRGWTIHPDHVRVRPRRLGAQSGTAAGRYDGLMRQLGEKTCPASAASASTARCWR
jgi:histidyl-tRNA synthetase